MIQKKHLISYMVYPSEDVITTIYNFQLIVEQEGGYKLIRIEHKAETQFDLRENQCPLVIINTTVMNTLIYYYPPEINTIGYYYPQLWQNGIYNDYNQITYPQNMNYLTVPGVIDCGSDNNNKTGFSPFKESIVEDTKTCEIINENIKQQYLVQTTISNSQESQSVKAIQNKTKDLMRPFARMLYKLYQRLLQKSTLNQKQTIEISQFNQKVDELRSKNPCKFTDLMINHLKTISSELRIKLQNFVSSPDFCTQLQKSDAFKHWKNKQELADFLKQFITQNRNFLKPTKFYKFQYKKLI